MLSYFFAVGPDDAGNFTMKGVKDDKTSTWVLKLSTDGAETVLMQSVLLFLEKTEKLT